MTKKAVLIRLTILLLAWQKRLKGRLKEYFHCLTKTFFISFGSMIFTYSSNHWLSETFLIQRKFFTCIKTYCYHIISIHALCFLCLPLSPATNKYTLASIWKIFQSQYCRFHLSPYQWRIRLKHCSIFRIITKIKHLCCCC